MELESDAVVLDFWQVRKYFLFIFLCCSPQFSTDGE